MRHDDVKILSQNKVLHDLYRSLVEGRIVMQDLSTYVGAERFSDEIKSLLTICTAPTNMPADISMDVLLNTDIKVTRATHLAEKSNFDFEVVIENIGPARIQVPIFMPNGKDGLECSVFMGDQGSPGYLKIFNKDIGALLLTLDPDEDGGEHLLEFSSGSFYETSDELSSDHSFINNNIRDKLLGLFQDPALVLELHLAAGNYNLALSFLAHHQWDCIDESLIKRAVESALFDNKGFMMDCQRFLPGGADDLEAAGFGGLLNYLDEDDIYQGAFAFVNGFAGKDKQGLFNIINLFCNGADSDKIESFGDALDIAHEGHLPDDVKALINKMSIGPDPALRHQRIPKKKVGL